MDTQTGVYIVLFVLLIGSIGGLIIAPPLLDKIDRLGKVGMFGF